ncbi:MAG: guanine deaminase, partial [Gammaproteobacteria bacterium]|nr:guanine deaminase [Gammaproteobacteria bacterium]
KWHNKQRLSYAVTPRFAPTSTAAQLEVAGQLLKEHDGLYCQTHVAENKAEVDWVHSLFPQQRSYLDVYKSYGLLSSRTMMAHCIYFDKEDYQLMAQSKTSASFCPTSNLFLGSGLFAMQQFQAHNINVSLGSDVGGGTSLNMLQNLNEAYKICQLQGYSLTASHAFYLLTLGAAKALSLEHKIGNFEQGKEADFIVLNLNATDMMQRRMQTIETVEQQLFVLMMLGDDRAIEATYIMGKEQYKDDV